MNSIMKEYKRLTKSGETIIQQYENIKPENRNKFCLDCFSRLAELEDKIENGTLIESPCRVDGVIYFVSKKNGIQWSGITEIQILIDRHTKDIRVRDDDYKWHTVNNKNIFLTKAEAEKKLEELKK